jgi:hypothetical protein
MKSNRDFELDEIEHLHERLSYPRMVLLLTQMERQRKHDNNWKLAAQFGLSIHDLRAIRHWMFEEKVVIRKRVKRILRAKIRALLTVPTHT